MNFFFIDLFEYNRFCNQKYSEVLINYAGPRPAHTIQLFSHIVNAHQIWNSRINGNQPQAGVWEVHNLEEIKKNDEINFETSLMILRSLDLEKPVTYINSKGASYTNPVKEILFHVINHSTYHRGQLASVLKQNDIQPPVTDYIFYKR